MSESTPTIRLPGEPSVETPVPLAVLARGATVGRYVIVSVVGEGGMGVVYAAYDSQLDRRVALKLLHPALAQEESAAESQSRLLREAQAMARLSHPNVVAVYDVGVHEHSVFLAMEYVEGETLRRWLKRPHTLRERLDVMKGAGKGLSAAHAAGLIHRDFKPENVLVGKDGRVFVFDFGIARTDTDLPNDALSPPSPPVAHAETRLSITGSTRDPLSTPLTLAGSILGTIGYMAPEQAAGEATTPATDQFSFAVTLYLALYGEKPFRSGSLEEYLEQIYRPVSEPKSAKSVPQWLRRIVLRGIAPEPKDRFPSLEALLVALDADPTVRIRRAALAFSMVVLLATTMFAVGRLARQREVACTEGTGAFHALWDEASRAHLVAAFAKTGAEDSEARAIRIADRLDEFGEQWVGMRTEVCRETRVLKQQSEEVFRLRTDCLDRELIEVRSLTSMLRDPDPKLVSKSTEIAYGLPQIAWCAGVATLRAGAGLPDDPAKRKRVEEIRASLAEGESNWLAGRAKEAERADNEAVTLARAEGHIPTTAEAVFVAGRQRQRQGEYPAAAALLREATFLGLRSSADSIVVRAASELAFVTGPELQHGDEARIWIDVARAALDRMGGNEELLLEVMRSECAIAEEVELHPEQAVRIGEKVVESSRRIYGVHPKTALAVYNLGNSYATLGDPERARPLLENAVSIVNQVAGPTFPLLGWSDQMLGQVLLELGEQERAKSLLVQSLQIFDQNGLDADAALSLERLAAQALERGDIKEASMQSERALERLAAAESPSYLVPIVNVTAALTRIRSGRHDAMPLCDRALAAQEESKSVEADKVYGWDGLRCKAEALIAEGKSADAVPLLERSLKLSRRTFRGDYARAEFAMARALYRPRGDHTRAFQEAIAARAEFAKHPSFAFELAEVEEWLSKRGGGDYFARSSVTIRVAP